MKKLIYLVFPILLSSCTMGTRFTYTYALLEPKQSNENKYGDEIISAKFKVDDEGVELEVTNLSDERISLLWNESTIVIKDEANAIIHAGLRYVDAGKDQIPSTIPPGAYIKDRAILINNLSYKPGDKYTRSGWVIKAMLPIWDLNNKKVRQRILDNKGQIVGLFVPIETQEGIKEYYFKFKITDVQKYKHTPPTWKSIYE
mgnify:CR=1 FL=1